MTPLVSVIIPVYNKEHYVVKCVTSVLEQTFHEFELIIVDDGSTDNSIKLVSQINDPRIISIRQSNKGPGAARNVGLSKAKGKYVTFLDADDYWEREFLKTAMDCLESNSECAVFICGSTWQPGDQVRLPILKNESNPASGHWIVPEQNSPKQTQQIVDFFTLGTVMLKREIPIKYNGFFEIFRCTSGEDAYLWIQIMFNHPIYRELRSLVTINIEGSDLGIGRGEIKPVPPSLLYPNQLYQNCPQHRKTTLSNLLDYIAFLSIRRELHALRLVSAIRLYLRYPNLVKHRTEEFPSFPGAFAIIPLRKIRKRIFRAN